MRNVEQLLEFAIETVKRGGQEARRYFQKHPAVEHKTDDSPVTAADRACERILRQRIEEQFPADAILGEEFGAVRPDAEYRWVLDPIDGTQTFIRGVPLWGTLLGLEFRREPLLGVVYFPALEEILWAARGHGAWWNGRQARVSSVSRLEDATLVLTDTRAFAGAGKQAAFERLRSLTAFERTWGDCYGHVLVATGRADIMLDPIMHEWDCTALLPIVEEAGGRFTDWNGRRTTTGGSAISTNALLFDAALDQLQR